MIAAEELDMDIEPDEVRHGRHGRDGRAERHATAARGHEEHGPQVRAAAAYARQALLRLASTQPRRAGREPDGREGVVSGGGKSVTYGELIGDKLFNVTHATTTLEPLDRVAPAKPVSQYKLVGTRVPRFDIPEKVTGT